jgi:hypothetical protein
MEILITVIFLGCGVGLAVIVAHVRAREAAGEIEARLAKWGGRRI